MTARDCNSGLFRTGRTALSALAALLLWLCPVSGLRAQETVTEVTVDARQATIDPFGNLYVLTSRGEFRKYDKRGREEAQYSDLQFSDFSEISAGHAFKSMVYYPEYDLIRLFGNKLQLLGELNLSSGGYGEITAVAPATGMQGFWLFDATAQRLVRLSQTGQVEFSGSGLLPVLGVSIFPAIMKEREGWLYVYDPDNGLYVFDNFGAFSRHYPVLGARAFSVFNDRIFYAVNGQVNELEKLTGKSRPVDLKIAGNILNMAFRQIVVQDGGKIKVLKF